MSPNQALGLFFTRVTDFKGRSRRREYWWAFLAYYGYLIAWAMVLLSLAPQAENAETLSADQGFLPLTGMFWISVMVLVPFWLALTVRRLHDLNQTGWLAPLLCLLYFIPILGIFVYFGQLIWFLQPGTSGPNKYGEDPKRDPTSRLIG